MATELICPDCGGVIGGDDTDTRPKCQCGLDLNSSMDDTEVEAQAVEGASEIAPPPSQRAGGETQAVEKPKKLCCKCGKDVTNAKRARDARGYWCWECHRNDLRAERSKDKAKARCPQCGRLVPAESITTYHGNTLCAKCRIEQDELPNHQKLKFKLQIDETKAKEIQKKQIYILAGIVAAFLILILVVHLRH